ncbi:MAG: T9SS type A sorting domain-containing protein [Bacteroidetes bacterium]|nr:T9SS type A sorting domain-containing protein [Bacteroidota bacterium]
MSSNGIWIANANNDTMLNGSGLNPNSFTSSWPFGQVITHGNIIITHPGDSDKFILFHQTGDSLNNVPSTELYYSIIDMSLDGGLGSVTSQKNIILFQDTLSWGLAACKHANGRDWWVVAMKDNSDIIYKILITPQGIYNVSTQHLNIAPALGASMQLSFSKDGQYFICSKTDGGIVKDHFIRVVNFDRCSGYFSNPKVFDVSGSIGWGLTFSPSGKYAYACSSTKIYQLNIDSLTIDTVAYYDGFISPPNLTCCATTFWNMYLAANGKIYITSGSGVQHLHEMNFPDSAGLACDVQQHAINLGYAQLRAVPNHPNYNLGPVLGSACDTLTSLSEIKHDFKFSLSPNPTSDGYIKLVYLLPQNKKGVFEVYNMTGQRVYEMNLPPWSTLQFVKIPEFSNGVYTCVIRSGYERSATKLVLMR